MIFKLENHMRFLVLFLVIVLIFGRCTTERALPTGYDQLQRQYKGEVVVTTLLPTETAHYWQIPSVGNAQMILIGREDDVRCYPILRFYPGTALDSTDNILSAELVLNQRFLKGESADSLVALGYRLTDPSWKESTVKWESVSSHIDSDEPIARVVFPPVDSAEVRAQIPVDLVKEWVGSVTPNGMILTFAEAPILVGFSATESSATAAYLQILTKDSNNQVDTVQVVVSHDATVIDSERNDQPLTKERNPEILRISNLSGFRTLLRFDLSAIPVEATIHQAYLTLPFAASGSETEDYGMGLVFRTVLEDSGWTLASLKVDSTASAPIAVALSSLGSVSFSANTTISTMSSIIQALIFNRLENYGFLVESSTYGLDAARLAIVNNPSDSTQVPWLRVTYSRPATAKFLN